jgi:type IV secretory pathway VirB9-like protein
VCDVELDAGEEVQNVSIGDTSRWLVRRHSAAPAKR